MSEYTRFARTVVDSVKTFFKPVSSSLESEDQQASPENDVKPLPHRSSPKPLTANDKGTVRFGLQSIDNQGNNLYWIHWLIEGRVELGPWRRFFDTVPPAIEQMEYAFKVVNPRGKETNVYVPEVVFETNSIDIYQHYITTDLFVAGLGERQKTPKVKSIPCKDTTGMTAEYTSDHGMSVIAIHREDWVTQLYVMSSREMKPLELTVSDGLTAAGVLNESFIYVCKFESLLVKCIELYAVEDTSPNPTCFFSVPAKHDDPYQTTVALISHRNRIYHLFYDTQKTAFFIDEYFFIMEDAAIGFTVKSSRHSVDLTDPSLNYDQFGMIIEKDGKELWVMATHPVHRLHTRIASVMLTHPVDALNVVPSPRLCG